MEILENVPLSELTTFRTGGPARFLLTIEDRSELPSALVLATKERLPIIPIGSGSNMLAPDTGVMAVFLRLAMNATTIAQQGDDVFISAEAGVLWDMLVLRSVSEGAWGFENLSAIPGTVGAAVVQNIGAYGAALSEHVLSVEVFDTHTGAERTLDVRECEFGYRTSVFKKELDRYVVLQVNFKLTKRATPNLSYRDLKNRFPDSERATLAEVRDAVIGIRKGKFPPLDEFGTAGSFFLNPIVSDGKTKDLLSQYPTMPVFPLPEGGVKIPLAWIFDHVLALKGERIGKAFAWHQQPLVLTAELGSTTDDVVQLALRIARAVFTETGVTISPEVRIFDASELFFKSA